MMNIKTMSLKTTARASSTRSGRPTMPRRHLSLFVDSLESRQMLAANVVSATPLPTAVFVPTSSNLADAQDGPMANLGSKLVCLFQVYNAGMVSASAYGPASAEANCNRKLWMAI